MEIEGEYELDIDPKSVCRLCLSQPTELLNIYSNTIVDGYIISLPQILQYTVDVMITADDKLPTKICVQCKKQIVTFYTFKQKSKRTEECLMSMFGIEELEISAEEAIGCSLCDAICQNEQALSKHMQDDHFENADAKIAQMNEEYVFEIIDPLSGENASGTDDDTSPTEIIEPKRSIRTRSSAKSKEVPLTTVTRKSQPTPTTSKKTIIVTEATAEESIEYADEYDAVNSESDIFECQHCAIQFLDKTEYLEHCKEHKHGYHQCDVCGDEFDDTESLISHECEVTEDDLICLPCNKRMRSVAQMRQHNKMHDSMNLIVNYVDYFPCHECCLLFMRRDRLLEHNLAVHGDQVPKDGSGGSESEDTKAIDETYTDYQFLDEDKQNEYRDECYTCGECEATCVSLTELKYHVLLHSEKFQCPMYECGSQYKQLSHLSIHVLNKHINTKNMQCLHCSIAFQTYDDLQAHIRNTCKEKKYACYECDKKFYSKKALSTHLRTLKEKKYKCDECGKTFKQQGELTIHKRSHTNERPFQCTICNKSYKTSSMRAAHMDSHISGKTFECNLCDKKLQSRTSYRNHMKRHTEEKKHECEYCSKRFFTRYHLRLHQSKIHKTVIGTVDNMEAEVDEIGIEEMVVFE